MISDSQHGQSFLEKAERIYKAALVEVDPQNLIKKGVLIRGNKLIIQGQRFDLTSFDNIFLAGIGKAASFMAETLMDILGNRVREGVVLRLPPDKILLKKITFLSAPHPLPDRRSLVAGRSILNLAKKASQKDLLMVLISGGGSAQACLPTQEVSLEEKRLITARLLKAGAEITELNTIRKHLSQIKGGQLAKAAFPATVVSLIISDVIHNDLETIASGPTYWDSSTYKDAFQVLAKYNLWNSAPLSIKEIIEKGMEKKIQETVKKDEPIFRRVHNFIIGDNLRALKAGKRQAEKLGFRSYILTSSDKGEAKEIAKNYVSLMISLIYSPKIISKPLCLLAGGELTVTVKGDGRGGRNQEFVLAALLEIEKHLRKKAEWLIISLGSDGIDGPTDAAGAWASSTTMEKAHKLSLDPSHYLSRNDSYNFFKKIGGLILTGPTHTNVMDLRLFIINSDKK